MSVLFTFPGQGSQRPGMLQQLPQHAACQAALAEAASVLGSSPLLLDSAAALRSTVAVQLCLLIAGVASARLLQQEGIRPQMVAGLSIGAFAAAVVAEALPLADALRLVRRRGQLMEQAYPQGYGMCAVSGLAQPQLANLLAQLQAASHPLYLANINAERQLVVAGSDAGLQQLASLIQTGGAGRCQRLDISVPSHCSLLDEAASALRQDFSRISLAVPRLDYLSASSARVLRRPEQIADDLAGNMARLVRWHDCSRLAYERGARLAVEMLPGSTLSKLVGTVFEDGAALALSSTRLDSLQAQASRWQAQG
ncbi:malonate decarboxylase subunit epsilon [Aquitalea sp. FJL05]|uniref:malonate decarboxylase subunit epsilon n=1 Tax=Aquitalea TaxID=407217 RepID=UPI000F5924EF|nr:MULTISPECIES: malonate decarboxylase subunit epsilon [Aquitalea]RQO68132.1 malonate decarboxylase subunit epsilon [Aquitalea sp. FJL05]